MYAVRTALLAPSPGRPGARWPCRVFALCMLWLYASLVVAQGGAQGGVAPSTPPELGLLVSAVREAPELSEEQRAPLLLTLQEAAELQKQAGNWRARAAPYSEAVERGEQEVRRYQRMARDAGSEFEQRLARLGDSPSLDAIESEISLINTQRKAWAEERAALLERVARERQLDAGVTERMVQLRQELGSVSKPVADGTRTLEQKVQAATTLARAATLEAELDFLEQRERGAAALDAIHVAQRAWLDAAIAAADQQLETLRERAAQTRQSRVRREVDWTRSLLARLESPPESLETFVEGNLVLIREQQGLMDQLERARNEITALREALERLNEDAKLTRRRLEVAGLESELGKVMLTRLSSLPDTRAINSRSIERNQLVSRYALTAIDHEEALASLADQRRFLTERFADLQDWPGQARTALNALYEQRRTLLRDNLQGAGTLNRLLLESNEVAAQLIQATENYERFLTANLLWTSNYDYASPTRLWSQLQVLASTDAPLTVWQQMPHNLLKVRFGLLCSLLLVLLYLSPRVKRARADLLQRPIRPRDESSGKIFFGLLLALLYVLPVPLAVYLLSLPLAAVSEQSVQAEGLALSLRNLSILMLALGMLRTVTGKFGVGRRLLKWNSQKIDQLRREMHWAYPLMMLATTVYSFGAVTAPATSGGALSAIATLLLSLVLLGFGVRVLVRGLFVGDRFLHAVFRIGSLAAFAIVVMHLSGHLFAAHQYLRSLLLSIAALITVITLSNILQRMLLIFRANIERRSRQAQRKPGTDEEESPEESAELNDVSLLSEAHNRLLGLLRLLGLTVLFWLIWSPALPALNIFSEVALWQVTDAALPEGELRVVSLATVLLVAAILVVTTLMTRHLPALVKVLLMEWGNVTPGSRYAIGMLMQYVLIGVGLSVSLSLLGWEWSKVQWLVAALGVGIGFGLQEIVANFISGIILLFERPIRVGDIITAGGDSGTVTRINPRATIIESFEGKELMIPNKDLITSVVINWSLSSAKLRVVIPVGVAYGTNVREAMRLLVEVARNNAAVIDEPEPMASFEDFGDNALTLWLRCYAEGEYVRVWTELRTEINECFEAAGISIAFPQRDVHLDAARPIPVRMVGNSEPV